MKVFLSYNRKDSDAVEEIARRLRHDGIEPWFDRWSATPGEGWQVQIAEALRAASACAVFVGPHGLGGWAREELAVAQDRASRDRRFRLFMVLLPGATDPHDPALAFLNQRTWVDLRGGIRSAADHRDLLRAIAGLPRHEDGVASRRGDVCPYRGLAPFDRDDAEFFFGRDDDAWRLVERIRAARFLAVLGSSGSGKSSLVRAGLLPALAAGALPGSERWPTRVFAPGERPLDTLAAQLTSLGAGESMNRTLDALRNDERSLDLAVSLALADDAGPKRLLLVVDQLEEVFTLCRDEGQRATFLASLRYASTIPGGKLVAVLAMRADFYDRCAEYRELASLINANQFLVGPLDREGLRAAVEEPAWRAGLTVEPGLRDTILDDVGDRPGALPLLQHVLLELWRRRQGNMLTLEGYEASGRVAGALAKRAEEIYGAVTADQQRIARQVLLRLVQPGDHTEDTRRRASLGDLTALPAAAHDVEAVITALSDSRLLVTSRDASTGARQVEITHEALIRGWPRLRAWIDSDREVLRERLRLTQAATEWAAGGHDPALLFRGVRLGFWDEDHTNALNPGELRFLDASRQRERRERTARRRRVRAALAGMAAALAVISVFAVLAVHQSHRAEVQRNIAQREANVATSRRLAADATGRLNASFDVGLLAGLEAYRIAPTTEARASLIASLQESPRLLATLRPPRPATMLSDIAFAPRGALVTASQDGTVLLWDTPRGRPVGAAIKTGAEISSIALDPADGRTLATVGPDGPVRFWDLDRRRESARRPIRVDGQLVNAAFAPDGAALAVASFDGPVRFLDLRRRASLRAGRGPAHANRVSFSPDGTTLATTSPERGPIVLWDVAARRARATIATSQAARASAVAFSPDGVTLAWGRLDGRIQLWDWRQNRPIATLRHGSRSVVALAFDARGTTLASGGLDGRIQLWDVSRARTIGPPLTGHAGPIQALAFSPDGAIVASAGVDGTARLWDARRAVPLAASLPLDTATTTTVAISPDGRTLASGGSDGSVMFWDPRRGRRLGVARPSARSEVVDVAVSDKGRAAASVTADGTADGWTAAGRGPPVEVFHGGVRPKSVAVSADGTVATAGFDPAVWLGDIARRRAPVVLSSGRQGYPGYSVRFSPNGRILAAGMFDGSIQLWDVAHRRPFGQPLGGDSAEIVSLAFSRDGRRLASGDALGRIGLWDVARGTRLGAGLHGHRGEVMSVAFAADGRTLASAGADHTVRLWDVTQRRALGRPLTGHNAPVRAVAVTPDGRVESADGAGVVLLWDRLLLNSSPRAWRQRICRLVGRSLTHAEWEQLLPGRPYERQCVS